MCVCVFRWLYFVSRSSDANESYEYAYSPRAFRTEACCRYSFPSLAPFLFLCHCFFLSRSLSQTSSMQEPDINSWKYIRDAIHKEYSMWRWKILWHCTNVWGEIKDSRVSVCACACTWTLIIQFDRLSQLWESISYFMVVLSRIIEELPWFENILCYVTYIYINL